MKEILPYGIKNKFKWKNGIQIRKTVKKVNKDLSESGKLDDHNFQDILSIIFQPYKIYAFFHNDKIVIQIYVSELGKLRFSELGHETYEIVDIEDEQIVLEETTKINFMDLQTNILYSEDLTKFEKIQKQFSKGNLNDEYLKQVCTICNELEHPEYTLIISSFDQKGKTVEYIVWNNRNNKNYFFCTENKQLNSRVKLGRIVKNSLHGSIKEYDSSGIM